MEKSATLLAYLLSKLINEQGEFFCLLHEKLRAGWKENLKNLSEHALLLGTSEYVKGVGFCLHVYDELGEPRESVGFIEHMQTL